MKTLRVPVDLEDFLATEDVARLARVEEGYDSTDSFEEFNADDDGLSDLEPDPEFSFRSSDHQRLDAILYGELSELSEDEDEDDLFSGGLPELTDSESEQSTSPCVPKAAERLSTSTASPSAPTLIPNKRKRMKSKPNAKETARRKEYHKTLRRTKRLKVASEEPRPQVVGDKLRIDESVVTLGVDIDALKLPVASTGYQGTRSSNLYGSWTRQKILKELKYVDWDASYDLVICDQYGRGIVHMIARPRDFGSMNEEGTRIIEKGRRESKFSQKQLQNRRGKFSAQAIGYSHGGGQIKPMNIKVSPQNLAVIEGVLSNPAIQRLSELVNSAYKRFNPAMYAEYLENDRILRRWNPELYKPFPNTVFAATTINYGPQTISEDHVDDKNYGPGSCAISNVGDFDDTKGGELVLWNLGLVVRFPAASSAILLSAVIRHSNLPIQPEERRYSVVQYSAGALFRFRYNGFRNDKEVLEGANAQERAEWRRASRERWKTSLGKFRLWKTD